MCGLMKQSSTDLSVPVHVHIAYCYMDICTAKECTYIFAWFLYTLLVVVPKLTCFIYNIIKKILLMNTKKSYDHTKNDCDHVLSLSLLFGIFSGVHEEWVTSH